MTKQTPALAIITLFCIPVLALAAPKAKSKTPKSSATAMAAAAAAPHEEMPATLPATTPTSTSTDPVSPKAPLKMTGVKTGKVSHLFFGANFLYSYENKAELADGRMEARMKALPLTLLRYPGGTIADNFHWKTTTLDNPNRFPYAKPADAPDMTNFDDFMAFCARTGAEPMLVVNTESWFLHNDIEGGVKEAADWVRYCKTKNYKVKYWEIGNEAYWRPVMEPREYGALVKRYSQAMKAVNPDIIISAVGHYEKDQVGHRTNFPRDQWDTVRQRILNIASRKDDSDTNAYMRDTKGKAKDAEKWWDGVLAECGQDIDMLSVHPYFRTYNVAQLDAKIIELRKYAKAKTGRDYILCASEYSIKSENEHGGWGLAEGICRMLNGGISLATYWPTRIGGESAPRALFDRDNLKTPRYPYHIFKWFSDNFSGGDIIKCAGTDKLFLFAAKTPVQTTLVVSARGDAKSPAEGDYDIAFDADTAKGKVTSVCAFSTDAEANMHFTKPAYTLKSNGMTLHIAPGAFTIILIKRP